jgi:ATP-binding cassette subfamily F protein 3
MLLKLFNICYRYETQEDPLFLNVNLEIANHAKTGLIGDNGTGKTTLLKIILGEETPDTGQILTGSQLQIGYSAQDLAHLHAENSILTEVTAAARERPDWVRTVLGCLRLEQEKVFQPISALSPGEKNKVSIAKILLSHANFLVLDEPTNHLDIRTREMLEDALIAFTGTMLFVAHDRRFIEKVATEIWDFWAEEAAGNPESSVD